MIYRVDVSAEARESIRDHVMYLAIAKRAPVNAERWLGKVWAAIDSLAKFPHRCGVIALMEWGLPELRCRRVGKYLLLFTINEMKKCVEVIAFQHGSKLPRRRKRN